MPRHLIVVEDEEFTGRCCSHCEGGLTAPRLEGTVAVLAFNRVATPPSPPLCKALRAGRITALSEMPGEHGCWSERWA